MSETPHQPGPNPQEDFLAAWHDIPGVIPDGSTNFVKPDSLPQSSEGFYQSPSSSAENSSPETPQAMLDREAEELDRRRREQQSRRAVQRASVTTPQPTQTPAPSVVRNVPQNIPDDTPTIIEHGFGRFTLRPWERSSSPFGSRRPRTAEEQARYDNADRAGRREIRAQEKVEHTQAIAAEKAERKQRAAAERSERIRRTAQHSQSTAAENAQKVQDTAADKIQQIRQKPQKAKRQTIAEDKIRRTQEIADDKARRILASAAYKAEQANKRIQRIEKRLNAPTRAQKRLKEQEELMRRQRKAQDEAAKGKYALKITDIRDHFDDNGQPLPMTERTRENLKIIDQDAQSGQNANERAIAWSSQVMRDVFAEDTRSERLQQAVNANRFNVRRMLGYNVVDVANEYMEPFGGEVILAQGYTNKQLYPIKTNHFQRGTGNTLVGYKTDETFGLTLYSARLIPLKPGENGPATIDPDSIKPLDVPLPTVRWTIHEDEHGEIRTDAETQDNAKQISTYTTLLLPHQISDRERAALIALRAPRKSKESVRDAGDPVDIAMRNLIETAQILQYLRNPEDKS